VEMERRVRVFSPGRAGRAHASYDEGGRTTDEDQAGQEQNRCLPLAFLDVKRP
jgi:hypothetical protein